MIDNTILVNQLTQEKIKFYRLVNGLLSIGYIAIAIWVIISVWNMLV